MRRLILKTLTVVAVMGLLCTPLLAQPIWLGLDNKNFIAVEALKPNFDGDSGLSGFSFPSAGYFISGRFSVGKTLTFVGELPIAHAGIDEEFFNESETTIGNPYLGLEFRRPGANTFIEFGGRLPTAPDDKFLAPLVGLASDLDRLEGFVPDLLAVTGKINYIKKNDSNVQFRLRGGPTAWIPTSGGGDTEFLLDYGAMVGFEGSQISIIGGVTGRGILSEDGSFGERTFHQLTIAVMVDLGAIIPGIQLRFPLDDDLQGSIDNVIGLNLAFEINN